MYIYIICLTDPHSLIVKRADVQARPELREDHRRQPFGEDVSEL
jgi:hypothetical protein